MSFTRINLAGESVLVKGTDAYGASGSEVLDATEYNHYSANSELDQAVAEVDNAIAELLAPIQAAAEKVADIRAGKTLDPLLYVVEQEEQDALPGMPRIVTKLSRDTVILRALDQGLEARLIWVNDNELAVTAAEVDTHEPEPQVSEKSDAQSE